MSKIYDIDFSCPYSDFMKLFQDSLDNYGNNNMKVTSSEFATKNTKRVYEFAVNDGSGSPTTTIVFDKNENNGDVILRPAGYSSYNNTFYLDNNPANTDPDDNTFSATMYFLETLAIQKKGLFAAYDSENDDIACIVDGKKVKAKNCIVDQAGNVYGAKEVKNVSVGGSGIGSGVSFKVVLKDWITARRAIDPAFNKFMVDQSISLSDKMNYVGKYVITLRNTDQIESDEFHDIFHQAGLFGYTDPAVLSIYKLII